MCMEDSISRDGSIFISTKLAGDITGYTSDYVGQLAREGHIESMKVGRNRFVKRGSLVEYAEKHGVDVDLQTAREVHEGAGEDTVAESASTKAQSGQVEEQDTAAILEANERENEKVDSDASETTGESTQLQVESARSDDNNLQDSTEVSSSGSQHADAKSDRSAPTPNQDSEDAGSSDEMLAADREHSFHAASGYFSKQKNSDDGLVSTSDSGGRIVHAFSHNKIQGGQRSVDGLNTSLPVDEIAPARSSKKHISKEQKSSDDSDPRPKILYTGNTDPITNDVPALPSKREHATALIFSLAVSLLLVPQVWFMGSWVAGSNDFADADVGVGDVLVSMRDHFSEHGLVMGTITSIGLTHWEGIHVVNRSVNETGRLVTNVLNTEIAEEDTTLYAASAVEAGVLSMLERWFYSLGARLFGESRSVVQRSVIGENDNATGTADYDNLPANQRSPADQPIPTDESGIPAQSASADEIGQPADRQIQELEQSFSDPVQVKRRDDKSGVITPQFNEAGGGEYVFIVVPVEE